MKKSLSFSQLKEELESIIDAMEDPSCPYETLKGLYERGDKIASELESQLSSDLEILIKKMKGGQG